MANKINYNNKAPFQTLEEIPDENKVNASDMNEIKQVVNTNADELNTAKEDIENLESGQGTSSTDIANLKSRVTTLETDNTTNKNNINNLQNNKVDKVDGKGLSTEDFTTELKSKLENLENYDDTEIKEDISNLEAGQTEQDKQIDMLINALPTETQEAENINIKGTIPVKFKEFVVKGNSKQEENVDLDYTTKNAIIIGGPALSNSDLGKTAIIKAKPNTTYTISRSIKTSRFKICESEEEWDESNNFALSKQIDLSELSGNYTTSKTGNYLYVFYWYSTGGDTTIPEITVSTKFSPEYQSPIQNVEGDVNVTVANKEKTEQQIVTFPLEEGQKLYLGDYLADDGIHHAKKQIELDGTENVLTPTNLGNVTRFLIYMKIEAGSYVNKEGQLSSHFKYLRNFTQDSEHFYIENDSGNIYLFIDSNTASDINSLKTWLSSQKTAGTPVILEYELDEEEIEPYTEAQQEAYNQICNLKAYNEETNVFSENEISPIFKVTAIKDINSVITQLNQLILEGGN